MSINKEALRNVMREKRREISIEERKEASLKMCKTLTEIPDIKTAENICVYMSAFKEADTSYFIDWCREKGKNLFFPVTDIKEHKLYLCRDCKSFVKGEYGILEPEKKIFVNTDEVDVFIIPGIAFDKENNRLGFGEGYYDKLLAESNGLKIGICYSFLICEKIECMPHDIKMDVIVTEKAIQKAEVTS